MTIARRITRLREDMRTNGTGQKDLEKLYWERELETSVVRTYGTYVIN